MTDGQRLSTGVEGLDSLLGGGLVPGTLCVVLGATGIGKTQLGIQFAHAGRQQEGRRGIIFDMACRGDGQSHQAYARRIFDWRLTQVDPCRPLGLDGFFDPQRAHGDYLHVFDCHGRRVTREELGFESWHDWQAELLRKLGASIAFLYGNFTCGVRRAVVDGIEPAERPGESIQFELFEYIYHQILRKDPEWVARDLFRQNYRAQAALAERAAYDPGQVGCLLLCTSAETMLDDLVQRKLDQGDVLANASTIIYLGKVRTGRKLGRGLYIAKHRTSACSDEVVPFTIADRGLRLG